MYITHLTTVFCIYQTLGVQIISNQIDGILTVVV